MVIFRLVTFKRLEKLLRMYFCHKAGHSEIKVCDECCPTGISYRIAACCLAGDGRLISKRVAEPKGQNGLRALQRAAGLGIMLFTGRIILALGPLRTAKVDPLKTDCPHWCSR